jgi:N-acetylmuramoyl-L-alanine amidase
MFGLLLARSLFADVMFQIDMKRENKINFKIAITFFLVFFFLPLNLCANDLLKIDRHVKRIIIDPGLGGSEKGAEGCTEGIYAKDINLEIS